MAQALALVNLTEGGFATINGDLPVFTGSSWIDHVQAWTDAESTVTEYRWRQAAIANSLTTHYGEGQVEQFAHEIGINPRRIWEYRAAYQLYQKCGRPQNLDFTHYVLASSATNPEAMIEAAAEECLSTRALKRLVQASKAPALDEIVPALSDDPAVTKAWEQFQQGCQAMKAATPRLSALIHGYLEEVQYELSLPAESIKAHLFDCIQQGIDEIDLIAPRIKRDRIHVQVWLNRMIELGELEEFEKERVPGARGAARTGYRIV